MVGELAMQDEAPVDDVVVEQQEQDAPQDNDYEKIARDRGWKPKEEYKGNPDNWAPADEYVKLTEDNIVFNRRAIDNLTKQVDAMSKGQQQILEQAEREKKQAADSGYRRAMEEMDARINLAVQEGDLNAVNSNLKIRDQIKEEHIKLQVNNVPREDPNVVAVRDNWRKENAWFDTNPLLNDWATRQAATLASQGIAPADQLQKISETVKTTFPHLFTNPNRENAPVMTAKATPNAPIRRDAGKPIYDNLNAEAKRNCDQWVRAAKYSFAGQTDEALRARWVGTADKESFK